MALTTAVCRLLQEWMLFSSLDGSLYGMSGCFQYSVAFTGWRTLYSLSLLSLSPKCDPWMPRCLVLSGDEGLSMCYSGSQMWQFVLDHKITSRPVQGKANTISAVYFCGIFKALNANVLKNNEDGERVHCANVKFANTVHCAPAINV